ncbi:integral membrane protein [Biomphalaria pfeifferi]|uniref:Integral membrane protein n=1 Tax=Biomphalaria pfeifferi TaxID=112525 RepID=A0AAD8AMY2_BIOPF|nr:integral membrane protein [Biomphalaria pfeifferi]
MSGENKVKDPLNNVPSMANADNVIITNTVFQALVTSGILLIYLVFRSRARWLYSPNIKNRPRHPCYGYTGLLSWIIPVLTVKDTVLLSIVGLDAFMMLQTLKLLYRILLVLSAVVVPALGYLYWMNSLPNAVGSDQWFVRLSLAGFDTESRMYGLVIPAVYFVSAFIMYAIFVYYKRYIVLRQAYLRNPAIMTSITTLKKLSVDLGCAEASTEYVNLPNKTLVLSRLPVYIKNDDDLVEFMNSLGVGEVDECVLVHDTSVLQGLYNERDIYIHNIEREINEKLDRMNRWSEKHHQRCAENIEGFEENIFKTVESCEIEGEFDDLQKKQLAVVFLNGAKRFGNRYKENVSKLGFYLDRLSHVNEEISKEKDMIKAQCERDRNSRIVELVSQHNSLFLRGDISEDASFFSMHHVLNCRKFKMYFTLDLPNKTRRGFVTFKDQRSASIVKQSQIGSRIFSVSAEDAPAPNDVIWENITKSEVESYVYSIFGTVFFFFFVILFSFIVLFVGTLLESSNLISEVDFLNSFLERHETIASFLKGVLFPLIYNSLLIFVPTVVTALVNMEGIYSYSVFQQKLMGRLNNFLFFNGFVSVFFASKFVYIVTDVLFKNRKLYDVVISFSQRSIDTSVFFANTIIQKSLFGTALTLLKPAPLLVNYILFPFTGRKTRRQMFESEFSPPFDFGTIFPSCLTVFSMSVIYAVICPPMLILGALFYICNYLAFKSEFLYSSRNEYESGGGYWDSACQNMMFSLIFFQVSTCAKIMSDRKFYMAVLIFPIILASLIFSRNLKKMFYKSAHFYPLNVKEEEYLDEFTEKMLAERVTLLESWSEMGTGPDIDILPLVQLGIKDTKELEKESYYKDPSMVISKTSLILPRNFFKAVWFLMKNDRTNLFDLAAE